VQAAFCSVPRRPSRLGKSMHEMTRSRYSRCQIQAAITTLIYRLVSRVLRPRGPNPYLSSTPHPSHLIISISLSPASGINISYPLSTFPASSTASQRPRPSPFPSYFRRKCKSSMGRSYVTRFRCRTRLRAYLSARGVSGLGM
jgi:hypothetical protein